MTIITAAFATTSSTSQIRAGSPTNPRTAAVFAAAVSASVAPKITTASSTAKHTLKGQSRDSQLNQLGSMNHLCKCLILTFTFQHGLVSVPFFGDQQILAWTDRLERFLLPMLHSLLYRQLVNSRSWEQDTKLDEYFSVRVCLQ
ncbi:hypothetical protein BDL97_05G006000 [Sphagnum fallax]|nr:hypothetical protein BDL97_05G006000 [Sphagnum fallax]KAH8960629.1 hypothetical protein BDL97_05G006000 [Sphagnum fallax]KAH8960630.1 hypothetical protein BDL97_05G006000 [Sphagnum fallax]KAH8960631.1 hypothetical protein BDL97_05G006000 [Sphagnum fallax]KAH8960632.1 hypothetical protein BDL97_05G006000 [Sphagnum fallax]